MKRLILIMLLFSAFANAQVLYMYPDGQSFYKEAVSYTHLRAQKLSSLFQ